MDQEKPVTGDPPRGDLSSIRDLPPPKAKPVREIKVDLPPYDEREGISATDRLAAEKARRPSVAQRLARTLVGFAAVAAVLLGIFLLLGAVDDNSKPSAAWSHRGAPVVMPESLDGQ